MGHQGHAERVTGTLTVPSDPSRIAGTKQIGRSTHVTAAVGATTPTQRGVPGIAVAKVEHLYDRCAVLGKKADGNGTATTEPAAK